MRFHGAGELEHAAELRDEQTLEALLGLIGRPLLVLFSGTHVAGELGRALER